MGNAHVLFLARTYVDITGANNNVIQILRWLSTASWVSSVETETTRPKRRHLTVLRYTRLG